MQVCVTVVGVSGLRKMRCMPLYVLLCTGVPLISKVPVTTQDEDKPGKANAIHKKIVLFVPV